MSKVSTKLHVVAPEAQTSDDLNGELHSETYYTSAVRLVVISAFLLLAELVWAWFGMLYEVSTGTGKVIPSSRDQVLGSLDEEILAKLDPTRSISSVGESAACYRAALAASARLYAEVNDQPLRFPDELRGFPELIA
ncbi:type I secretion membrane fusion protein, HlyD family|nr:type I secretion membrane fusion protein, HlyD family [Candidatus Pantoea persica]